jgi:hypothetical protein
MYWQAFYRLRIANIVAEYRANQGIEHQSIKGDRFIFKHRLSQAALRGFLCLQTFEAGRRLPPAPHW